MSEGTDITSDNRKSVFPKFEPGNTGRNLLLTVFYGFVWPVGIVAMFYGLIRRYRDEEDREMGLGENLLTLWLGVFVAVMIIAVSFSTLGVIPEEGVSQPEPPADSAAPTETRSATETVTAWLEQRSDKSQEAHQYFRRGSQNVENEEWSLAVMNLEKARNRFADLQEAADKKADTYEEGTRKREMFDKVSRYYAAMFLSSNHARSAAVDYSRGDYEAGNTALQSSLAALDEAEELRQELQEELGVEP